MAETYAGVLDRISAFNVATEKLSKGRVSEVRCDAAGAWLRLVKTAEHYAIELPANAVLPEREAAAAEIGFSRRGDLYVRDVRKAERSWNIAGLLEDVLHDVLGLPADVPMSVSEET